MNEFIWLGILIIAFITELTTAALIAVWFMPGAVAALVLAALNLPIWVQVLVFLIISAVSLILSKTIFKKYIRKTPISNTNSDALIGETGVVTEDIDNIEGRGLVKVKSQVWTARSEDPTVKIASGSLVEIKSIEGVKLICNKID
ncbi:MAG: NfeD family protein [Ruminococcaceae bacterium]|nr:NfeD family protein [Oscillospiraceae bacterium]